MSEITNHLNNFLAAAIETAAKHATPAMTDDSLGYWTAVAHSAEMLCVELRKPTPALETLDGWSRMAAIGIGNAIRAEKNRASSVAMMSEIANSDPVPGPAVQIRKRAASARKIAMLSGLKDVIRYALSVSDEKPSTWLTKQFRVSEVFNGVLRIAEIAAHPGATDSFSEHLGLMNTVFAGLASR